MLDFSHQGKGRGTICNKRKLLLPLVLDLVSYGHDANVNHAGKAHEISSFIFSVMKYLKLGTSAPAIERMNGVKCSNKTFTNIKAANCSIRCIIIIRVG